MNCPYCGAAVTADEVFCGSCGRALKPATQPLPNSPPGPSPAAVPPAFVPPPVVYPALAQPATGTPYMAAPAAKDPQTALVIELVAGIFGFLGIGHLYAGRTSVGISLLIAWWVFLAVEIALFAVLIGFCLLPLNVAVPIASGFWLKNEMQRAAGQR